MRYFFLPFLLLLFSATSAHTETLQTPPDCDTLITKDGQIMLVSFLSQGPYDINYHECDGISTKVKTVRRDKIREIRLRKDFNQVPPSRGIPVGASRWLNFEEKIYRDSMKVMGLGAGSALSFLLLWILAALTGAPFLIMLAFFSIGLMIATMIKGSKMLRKIKEHGDIFRSERNIVIAGMVMACSVLGIAVVMIFFAIVALIIWGF